MKYQIESKGGVILGVYVGVDQQGALINMAAEAGSLRDCPACKDLGLLDGLSCQTCGGSRHVLDDSAGTVEDYLFREMPEEQAPATKLIEFFGAGPALKTAALLESVKAGSLPQILKDAGVHTEENSWMREHGHSEYDSTYVSFPEAGYKAIHCSARTAERVAEWLDTVSPGWQTKRDGYGNPCVKITDYRADPLENVRSPESRGDYI